MVAKKYIFYSNFHIAIFIIPVAGYPNCLHVTLVLASVQSLLQTVPQALLIHISRRPALGVLLLTSRS